MSFDQLKEFEALYQTNHRLTESEEELFRKLFKQKFGYDPVHVHFYDNPWVISSWNTEDVAHINELGRAAADHPNRNDPRQFEALNKIWDEIANSKPGTTIQPIAAPIIKTNVLTNGGMTEMGKRSTGESSSTNAYMNIGTGTTPEDDDDDTLYSNTLQTQQARKATGSKACVSQQERYSTSFDDADVTGEPLQITEAGINTASATPSGLQIARVTFSAQTIDVGKTVAFQAYVNHRNGTS